MNYEYGARLVASGEIVGIGPTETLESARQAVIDWRDDGFPCDLVRRPISDWEVISL